MILLLGLILPACLLAESTHNLSSPDGNLRCLITADQGNLTWSVNFNGKAVIEKSPIKMMVDGIDITSGVKTGKQKTFKTDETYPWYGLHSPAINRSNGIKLAVLHLNSKTNYELELRVFNDAVAFRLVVPESDKVTRAPDESTGFMLPSGSTVWYHDLYMHYEGAHERKQLDTIPAGQWAAPPLTVKLPGNAGYAAIAEADLKNYAGMALQSDGKLGFTLRLAHLQPVSYPYKLRYSAEDIERLSKIATVTGTITTPWRVVMIAKDLNTLVNCDALSNLCAAPDPKLFPEGISTPWIVPGAAVWRYLDAGGERDLPTMKDFSLKAGKLGFKHHILEGFWSKWSDKDILDLVSFSRNQGIGIWVWKHSKELRDQAERLAFFDRCQKLGIAGVKIDFFDHEAKEVIDLYQSMLLETAERKLLVDFHGANKPTGESRTWPNELTREGVKGMESSKLMDRASHNTTLPFTRYLAGHAEYTPVHFGERRRNTTWAHQLASAAILWAPVQTYAANPDNLLSNPGVGLIKSLPTVWDETRVLPPSEIGEIALFAQRKGSTWFLSVMNGIQPKHIRIPLTFLSEKNYKVLLARDIPNETESVKMEETSYTPTDNIDLELSEGGGFMARFESVK